MAADLCTRTFSGPGGLRSVPAGWSASAPVPDAFRAQVAERRLAGVLFFSLVGTAHEARRSADADFPERGIAVIHALSGAVHYDTADEQVSILAGQFGVLRNVGAIGYRIDEPTRTISVVIPEAAFPADLLDTIGPVQPHILSPAITTQPLANLMQEVMFGDGALTEQARRYLGRAVLDLAVGLVIEMRHETGEAGDGGDVRARVTAYIDDHLSDPDLSPKSIADALGFSVRYLHQVYSAPGVSVARYIRYSRLDRVVVALQESESVPKLGPLATRFGFSSADHLARAFRDRFGETIGQMVAATRA